MKYLIALIFLLCALSHGANVGIISAATTGTSDGSEAQTAKPAADEKVYIYYTDDSNQAYSYWDSATTQKVTVVIVNSSTNTYYDLNQ